MALSIAVKRDSISDESDKDGNIIASERQTGRFGRQYSLPDVDVDKIEARYENGVLQLTLPKKAAADTIILKFSNGLYDDLPRLVAGRLYCIYSG